LSLVIFHFSFSILKKNRAQFMVTPTSNALWTPPAKARWRPETRRPWCKL